MSAREHHDHSHRHNHHHGDHHHHGHSEIHHAHNDVHDLYGPLPDSSPYRHTRGGAQEGNHSDLLLTNPYDSGGGAHSNYENRNWGQIIPASDRRGLIAEALRLSGLPPSEQNISAVNTIVTRESSWNRKAINRWDSNARRGHPSEGLMQTIPGTFNQYRLPQLSNDIQNPLSNLVAGIRYAQARYGNHGMSGVAWVARRPGGY
jgi:hypothetical protein